MFSLWLNLGWSMFNVVALVILSVIFWGCGVVDEGVDVGCLEKMDFFVVVYDWVKVNCLVNFYWLIVLEICESGGCGVILDVYGGSMNVGFENVGINLFELGINVVFFGVLIFYIVVQLLVFDIVWVESGVNDKSVYGFLESVVNVFNVDIDCVYMGGFFQGSFMIWRFMCKYFDMFVSLVFIVGINFNN